MKRQLSRSDRKQPRKLTELQERQVLREIPDHRPTTIQKYVNELLLRNHRGQGPPATVSRPWCDRFIERDLAHREGQVDKQAVELVERFTQPSCEDLFTGPVRGTRSSSFQSNSSAATPPTTPTPSIGSNTSTTENQQPTTLNYTDFVAIKPPVASVQDPNLVCTIRPASIESDKALPMGLQLRQEYQQLVQCPSIQTTIVGSALAAHEGLASNAITYPVLPIADLTFQLQLTPPRKVPDTAESIWFAMKGDTGALKRLFSKGLACPVEVSSSRELSLLGVCPH